MTYDEWTERYQPIHNPHDDNAAMDGTMFKTHGPEVRQVFSTDLRRVWTLTDCDGREVITSGWHVVNRIGYFITSQPHDGDYIEIPILTDEDAEELKN